MSADYNIFLQRWKEERRRCGLTQQQLCRYADMKQSTFSKAEAGQRRFSYRELRGVCASDMDIYYIFTGNKAISIWESPGKVPSEILCQLCIIHTHVNAAWALARSRTFSGALSEGSIKSPAKKSFQKVREQLEYLQYLPVPGGTGPDRNIFHCARSYYGYTQRKMADILGVDIKKLRELEKGKQLPDSEIIWRMYDNFRVSPALILRDAGGLWSELNYVLELLESGDRTVMLQILENGRKLMRL